MISITRDRDNPLLKRREIECIFKGEDDKITREEAVNMIKSELGIDKVIIPITIASQYGKRDRKAIFYIYDDKEIARRYLPAYILKRVGLIEEGKKSEQA